MQISHNQLNFGWNDCKRQIYLTNNAQSPFIFKIKTTSLQLLQATPIRGYIQQKQTMTIEITCKLIHFKFQAKLQVIWTGVGQRNDSIQNAWKKVNPNSCHRSIILISRKQSLSTISEQVFQSSNKKVQIKSQQNNQEDYITEFSNSMQASSIINHSQVSSKQTKKEGNTDTMLRSVTSPLKKVVRTDSMGNGQKKRKMFQSKMIGQQQIDNKGNLNKQQTFRFQASRPQSQNIFTRANMQPSEVPGYSGCESMGLSQLSQLCFIQSQLLSERQQNSRLKQQIRKNRQLQESRNKLVNQYQVNTSMTQQCEHEHLNLTMLLMIALIFFTIGVLISRF